jgi:predicted HTH transcriptional regulator
MRRYNQFSSFDEQPMPDLNSEAIDFRAASEYFKRIRKLTLHGLQSLKLTASYQGRIVLLNLKFFARRDDSRRHGPQADLAAAGWCGRSSEC